MKTEKVPWDVGRDNVVMGVRCGCEKKGSGDSAGCTCCMRVMLVITVTVIKLSM